MENFKPTMEHPILNNIWKTIVYLLLLLGLSYFYFLFSSKYILFSATVIWTDTIISFVSIGLLNLGIWYYVFYNKSKEQNLFWLIIKHLSAGIIYSVIWLFSSWLILIFFVQDKNDYFDFLQKTFEIKFFLGLMIYFLTILFYKLTIISRNNKTNLEQRKELTLLLQQEELNSLKSQINPHFLFNSLNSISSLVYQNPDDANEAIVKLSEYFRYSLTLSKNQFTKLHEEIDNVQRYFEIEKIRFPNKMIINYDIESTCNDFLIPVLILQPIAENAVKHGVYQNVEKSNIDIIVRDENEFFSIIFKNNYEKEEKKSIGTSTGIENVRKRLIVTYKRYDLLTINKTDEIFEVKIFIPKETIK